MVMIEVMKMRAIGARRRRRHNQGCDDGDDEGDDEGDDDGDDDGDNDGDDEVSIYLCTRWGGEDDLMRVILMVTSGKVVSEIGGGE